MRVNFDGNLTGVRNGVNKKTAEPYQVFSFVGEDGRSLDCMTKDFTLCTDVKRLALYRVVADLNMGNYSSITIVGLEEVKKGA